MNEKLDYVEMLEIPINTTSVTFKPSKKRRKKKNANLEEVKDVLIEKVNNEGENLNDKQPVSEPLAEEFTESNVIVREKEKKPRKTISVIAIQLALIIVLMGVIAVSNIYIKDSGINTFIRTVFSSGQKTVQKSYNDYNILVPKGLDIAVNNGVMSYTGKGSIYALVNGEVTKISEENGKKTIEIKHSDKFKTVIKGIDYAYCDLGTTIYSNIPIGYSLGENIEMCFYNEDAVVTNFKIDGEALIWQA